ncbi:Protein DEL-7 [Aphelenchoides avenae]|nr:Protein DEL-7 [Aphelenchus avenae]
MKLRKVKLLSSSSDCDTFVFDDISIGAEISKCYHLNWVRVRWWKAHNCTIFHEWRNASQYEVCDPGIIVRDYHNIVNDTVVRGEKCLPACNREFRDIVLDSRIKDGTTADDELTISIHYGDLEYENVEEISVTVLPRFISELGGQANLFVGLSILHTQERYNAIMKQCREIG